jgi:hypothetical protein
MRAPVDCADVTVAQFNSKYPPGTPVLYWTGRRRGPGTLGRTRTDARIVCATPVVWIKDVPACIALTHVQVMAP